MIEPNRKRISASREVKLSNHCLIDHFVKIGDPEYDAMPGHTPIWFLRGFLMYLDRKMYFTGFRGALWRILGVDRSPKNPNLCNI